MKSLRTLSLIAFVLAAANLFAQAPKTMSYQGQILDASAQPVTGSHTLMVKLYDVPSGGAALHTETFTPNFEGGYFSVILGTQTAFPPSLAFDKQYWLSITIDGGAEMSPRTILAGAPYAMMAGAVSTDAAVTKLNGLNGQVEIVGAGGTSVSKNGNTITITGGGGGANGVTNINGQDGAITLQGGGGTTITNVGNTFTISSSGGGGTGIQGVQSSDGSLAITSPNGPTATINLAPDAVKNANIDDNAVNTAEIAANAVTGAKIVDGAISTSKIGDGQVTTAKINDGAITSAKVGVNQINGLHILGDCITATHIATNGVNTAEIANGAVTLAKMSTAGASNGNVLTYNGSNIVWAAPAGGGGGITTLTNGDGMIAISNPTGPTATLNITNNSINAGKLNTDAAMLTKVSGNFLQASGAGTVIANADIRFQLDTQAIMFPNTSGANEAMIYMFQDAGNDDRMVLAHSPAYPSWGLQYRDVGDEYRFLHNGTTVMNIDLGQYRVGIGDIDPTAKLEVVHGTTGEPTILARQTATGATVASLKATTASTNTTGFAIEGVAVTGSAVVGQNNSSNTPAVVAINTSSSANSPIFQAKTSTGAGYAMQVDKEGDMYLYGHLSANDNLGATGTPADGGVYFDNVLYAWGSVVSNGTLSSGFGMSVSRTGVGTYNVTFNKTLTNGQAPVATAHEASAPQFAVISAISTTGCTVKIWKFNAGSFALVDSNFYIQVAGRPTQF